MRNANRRHAKQNCGGDRGKDGMIAAEIRVKNWSQIIPYLISFKQAICVVRRPCANCNSSKR